MMRKWHAAILMAATVAAACGGGMQQTNASASASPQDDQILLGRQMVIQHDCGACHGGGTNPAAERWLQGDRRVEDATPVGPFKTYAANLTPDVETGIGRYSERQIYNALRYGLKPSATPDIDITSHVPGQGNFPAKPKYLAPTMPWAAWRHMTDDEIRAVAAYLKRGLKPVSNKVPEGSVPPDDWASEFTVEKVGPYPIPAYPAAQEVALANLPEAVRPKVTRGRFLAFSYACTGCHSARMDPNDPNYLAGVTIPEQEWQIGPFKTRPRNLTPDNTTGMGRFTERQVFNALRFGLRPGDTPDVEITSTTPGEGNFPMNPKYLAPPMPWPAWRHLPDADLWALAAYLKYGVKPVRNRVADSEGPPDFWADTYKNIGPRPAVAFPTANETR